MPSGELQREGAKVLEWDKLLAVLASFAQSAMGAEQCRSLGLEQDLTQAVLRQQETSDMVLLQTEVEPFPLLQCPNVTESVAKLDQTPPNGRSTGKASESLIGFAHGNNTAISRTRILFLYA